VEGALAGSPERLLRFPQERVAAGSAGPGGSCSVRLVRGRLGGSMEALPPDFFWHRLFFLTLAPVLNSRWLGPNVFTERYLYLPSVGFCWVAAWGILRIRAQAAGRRPAWGAALGIVLGVVGVLAAVRIVTRNRDWRDEITYYRATLAAEPEAASLRINLGASTGTICSLTRRNASGGRRSPPPQ